MTLFGRRFSLKYDNSGFVTWPVGNGRESMFADGEITELKP